MTALAAARPARAGRRHLLPLVLAVALALLASSAPVRPGLFGGLARPGGELTPQTVFVENRGQVEEPAAYYTRSGPATFFFAPGAVTASLAGGADGAAHALRISFEGADPQARIESLGRARGVVNLFLGQDPSAWQTRVPTHTAIAYRRLWPGIDVQYLGASGRVESVYTLAPGADPAAIRLRYEGAERLYVDTRGNLVAQTPLGALTESAPAAYQLHGGARARVDARYMLVDADTVGFGIGEYDPALPLVIDPSFGYSTYLGGTGTDQGNAIAVDASGNTYITGLTTSTDFPTVAGGYQAANGGNRDVFVTKLSPTGSLVYSTYIGGSALDEGNGIDVDGSGNAYITGVTASANFPTVGAYDSTFGGINDAFVTKLNAGGSALVFSTYLGGADDDEALAIAIDPSNNAYVTGVTFSDEGTFPVLNAYQPALVDFDAFVAKLNSAGNTLGYSTYLGGAGLDEGFAIAVDGAGSAYVTGSTLATDFPTASPFRPTSGGGRDGFITKLGAGGSTLSYSTYLGGSASDYGAGLTVDASGNAYVAGLTASTNFPTANALQAANAGADDAFITKLNAAGSAATYSTYLGGSGGDGAGAISLDTDDGPVITGSTFSSNFPTAGALQGPAGGGSDAFVAKLAGTGLSLAFSTYLGGSTGGDRGWGVAVSGSSQIYVTGSTFSTNFPTANALQGSNAGLGDGFVTLISPASGVDTDGDGCPDVKEQQTAPGSEFSGGRRDYLNPWDFFNPLKTAPIGGQTIADILMVVQQYNKNQYLPSPPNPPNTPNPAYTNTTDRTGIPGGYPWSLGPPDGLQGIVDVLAAVKQYNHNCT